MDSKTGKLEWYLAREGQRHGPLSAREVAQLKAQAHLRPGDLLWRDGLSEWIAATEWPDAASASAAASLPEPMVQPAAADDIAWPDEATTAALTKGGASAPPDQAKPTARPTAQPAQGSSLARRSGAIYAALVLLLVGLSLSACLQFLGEGTVSGQTFASRGADPNNAIRLAMQVVEVNLPREQVRVAVTPTLTGRLSAGSPRLPARDIELTLATVNGPRVLSLKREHHIEPFDVDVQLTDGDILLFPADTYRAWIEAEAIAPAVADAAPERLPVVIAFNPRNHAMHIAARESRQNDAGDAVVRLQVGRMLPILAFTWFMAGIMALISLAVAAATFAVISGRREPELGMLVWSTAMLFALPAVRNNMPGAPPLGALVDYCFFFWAEALVGLSLLVLLVLWFAHRKPTA